MAGSNHTWQLLHETPTGEVGQIPVHIIVDGPALHLETMNNIISNILIPDIMFLFPVSTYQDPPNTIELDYAPASDMLTGFRITMAGHGACKYYRLTLIIAI